MEEKNLTIDDIILSPEFTEAFNSCKNEIRQKRIELGGVFKRGPLERLAPEFNSERFKELYIGVLDSSLDSQEYPSAVRAFIKMVGDEAFRRALAKIQEKINTLKSANNEEVSE